MSKINGKIKSIKLINMNGGVTWKITIIDENENIVGVFYNENLCDNINFRTQTFGIMQVLGNNNLLALDGKGKTYPIFTDTYKNSYRISCIANKKGDFISMDKDTAEISSGTNLDVSEFEERELTSIESASLCLAASTLKDGCIGQNMIYPYVYIGFTPIYPQSFSEKNIQISAHNFKTVICTLLKICNIDELIQNDIYPNISVILDYYNNVVAIGNNDTYLSINENGFDIGNSAQLGLEKIK